jgi:NAD(P)-dependent dehydrogenase (short-subunit alcohol dehydrogenase family)
LSDNFLEGRVAVVTGAGSGIGWGIGLKLLRSGAKLALSDLYDERLYEFRKQAVNFGMKDSDLFCLAGDLSDTNFVRSFVQKTSETFGKVDILVNNAGGSYGFAGRPFVTQIREDWDIVMNGNLYTTLNCTRFVLPTMIERKYGKIVNIGSTAGIGDSVTSGKNAAMYSVAKAGVIQFTRAIAREAAEYGINVNCVSPGLVRTRIFERSSSEQVTHLTDFVKQTPLGRIGEPEDIANVVLFLVSESANWLTGQNICVSGGMVMH